MISGEEIMGIARGVAFRMKMPPWLREEVVDEAIAAAAAAAKEWNGCGSIQGWIGYKTRFAIIKFIRREMGLLEKPPRMVFTPDWEAGQNLFLTLTALKEVLTPVELGVMLMSIHGCHRADISRRFCLPPQELTKMLAAIHETARGLEMVDEKCHQSQTSTTPSGQ